MGMTILIAFAATYFFFSESSSNSLRTLSEPVNDPHIMELTDENISSAINGSSFLILDFYYPGCGPCKFMNNTTSELSQELRGQIDVGRISIRSNPQTARKYKVSSYPTLLFFDEGVLVDRIKGKMTKSELLDELKDLKPDLDTSNVKLQPVNYGAGLPEGEISLTQYGVDNPALPMLITDEDINSAIKKYPSLVISASTDWCDACKRLNVTLLELSQELRGQMAFGLIDIDSNYETKAKYNITSYPTLLMYKDGKLIGTLIGNRAKSVFVSELKKYYPQLDITNVNIEQTAQHQATLKLTPEQICANMSKSDKPLLEAFIVSECPFGLQMQRIMADIIGKAPDAQKFMKARYIGSVSNNAISSMHGEEEAQENLRQICIREEQANKYWSYVGCYMKEGKSSECLKSSSIDQEKVNSCMKDPNRGVAYAQEDFDLADKMSISGSPTIYMNGKIVSEFDFATDTIDGRSPEALKNMLCCAFKSKPIFCSQELNKTQAMTMFSVKAPSAATAPAQATGRDIALIPLGEVNPTQPMLITDDTMNSAISQYPLLVVQGFVNWCGYCRNMNVTISELSEELKGQAAFGLIDIDSNNKTKAKYNITSYPTMLIFKDGELIETVIGYQQKSTFADKLKQIEPT